MNYNKLEINVKKTCSYKYFLLTFDDNYANVAIGLMKSLICNTSKELCFIIMTKSLNENSISKLKETLLPTIIYYVDKDLFNYFNSNWPIDSTFRLIAPWVIEEKMDYLYYLDADILCVSNIDDLFKIRFSQSIALCPEISANAVSNALGTDLVYCNSGFLIYNISRLKTIYDMNSLLDEFNKISKDLKFPDQDFINLYYKNDCLYLNPFKYNNQIYDFYNKHLVKKFLRNAMFVHFCVVKGKPWNTNSTLARYNIYLKYSKDSYMRRIVTRCKRIYLIKYPFSKLYSISYRIIKKIYKCIFKVDRRRKYVGGVQSLTFNFDFVPLPRLCLSMEVI